MHLSIYLVLVAYLVWHPLEEILSYSHSRKPDLPVTHFSPFSTWLSVLLFFFLSPAETTLSGQGYGFCWWRR